MKQEASLYKFTAHKQTVAEQLRATIVELIQKGNRIVSFTLTPIVINDTPPLRSYVYIAEAVIVFEKPE